jgi:cytochrome c peroxidase
LFTDFTASNIGTPANPRLPYYREDRPDALGYVANPAGASFVDGGVGNFLANGHLLSQPSAVDARWLKLAPGNQARIQVPTLRNVDKRPAPNFVKAYMHNGYFTSLKAICISTTRATSCRAASPMTSVKVRHAGLRRNRPRT